MSQHPLVSSPKRSRRHCSPGEPPALPAEDTVHWVAGRKAAVACAVVEGRLTRLEAYRRYRLGEDELGLWIERWQRFGVAGLRATRGAQPPDEPG